MSARPPVESRMSGWYEQLDTSPLGREFEGIVSTPSLVVGAGVTGLAAARRLGEHGNRRVLLLEAARVGAGASGRNSGFATPVSHQIGSASREDARRRARLCRAGISALRELVREHEIECDWDDRGHIVAAATRRGRRALRSFARFLDQERESYEVLAADKLEVRTGSGFYREGIHLHGAVLLQPAALVRGLAASLPPNVELCENSPIVRLEREGSTWVAKTPRGEVRAEKLIIAANALAPELGFLSRRLLRLFTFASLTRRLSAVEQQELGGASEWGVVSEESLGATLRRTRDQRLLIRSVVRAEPRLRIRETTYRRVKELHAQGLRRRFPQLGGVEIEYSWGGAIALTGSGMPCFGRVGEEAYASAGYNGSGIALGTACGTLIADMAVGATSALLDDAQRFRAPSCFPAERAIGAVFRAAAPLLDRHST